MFLISRSLMIESGIIISPRMITNPLERSDRMLVVDDQQLSQSTTLQNSTAVNLAKGTVTSIIFAAEFL